MGSVSNKEKRSTIVWENAVRSERPNRVKAIGRSNIATHSIANFETVTVLMSYTTFCEITGGKDDDYRSGDFYSQYVKAYYEVNRSPVIGSKVFNKFLRSYCPDKLRVAPLHVSASNNVQHIFGMKFDEDRFRQYIEEHQAEKAKKQGIFDSYIEDIFSYVEKDFADIYDAIAASIDSNQSPLQ